MMIDLHDVHCPFGDEAGALGLIPGVLQPLHNERVRRRYLDELDVAVSLAAEETHLSVRVEEGHQDAEKAIWMYSCETDSIYLKTVNLSTDISRLYCKQMQSGESSNQCTSTQQIVRRLPRRRVEWEVHDGLRDLPQVPDGDLALTVLNELWRTRIISCVSLAAQYNENKTHLIWHNLKCMSQ